MGRGLVGCRHGWGCLVSEEVVVVMSRGDVVGVLRPARPAFPCFRGWDLVGADLSGLDLGGCSFVGADLRGVDFRGSDLSGASLGTACLVGADLGGAVLDGAVLRGADLAGADLSGVSLFGAVLEPWQLLDVRGLGPHVVGSGVPGRVWRELLPSEAGARGLVEELLVDWEGTVREALVVGRALRSA